jgi:hypothetical protein
MSTAGTSGPGTSGFRDDQIKGAHETYPKGEVSSIGALIGDVATDLSNLMRQEVALAKAEARESRLGPARAPGFSVEPVRRRPTPCCSSRSPSGGPWVT